MIGKDKEKKDTITPEEDLEMGKEGSDSRQEMEVDSGNFSSHSSHEEVISSGKSDEIKLEDEIEKLRSETRRLQSELEDYKTRWIYTFSEYENYRKRVKVEIENAVKDALIKVFINIISALDSLELALNYIKDEESKKGIELVRQIIIKALFDSGLKEIEIVEGQKFSPSTCEAVDFVSSDEYEEGTIVKVLRKGYEFQGRVVRPTQVVVSKRKNGSQRTDEKGNDENLQDENSESD